MDDLPLPEIADGLQNIRVVHQAEDVVIGGAGLLLGGHILMEVGDGVALGLEIIAGEAGPAGSHGIDPRGVIDKIVGEALGLDLLHGEVAGELIDHGRDHLKMRQLVGTLDISVNEDKRKAERESIGRDEGDDGKGQIAVVGAGTGATDGFGVVNAGEDGAEECVFILDSGGGIRSQNVADLGNDLFAAGESVPGFLLRKAEVVETGENILFAGIEDLGTLKKLCIGINAAFHELKGFLLLLFQLGQG